MTTDMRTTARQVTIRLAAPADLPAIAAIYEAIHDLEAAGTLTIGWQRGVYPTENTAREAIAAGEMYVLEDGDRVVASARINQAQMPAYAEVKWRYEAPDEGVLVLHTLTVDPARARRGYARQFLDFYEELARKSGCAALRIDTNERNAVARAMYARHGYIESGIIPCTFNGIAGVGLVCMEKAIGGDGQLSE